MSLLSVTVKKARYAGIQAQQYNSYVTLKLQNVKSTTVTVKGPNPCWEQDFLFETNDVNTGLLIEVWSKGMIWDRALGYNYIPLRDIQYSNEEGNGQWVSLDAELIMRDGEVVGTKTPTGDSLLIDCRFELPFGRYDPPSGWKCLLGPDSERRAEPRSLGDEDNTDWLPFGRHNLPDQWSGRDAENTAGDALQRKLERLNSTILGHDEQTRRQQYYGHSGYSEDSDYTSDLNYPIGQHPNSSASQFRTAAQLMRTPDRSLETSRENSYERDDAPGQSHQQVSHHLPINHSSQQGRGSQNYKMKQCYGNYNETEGDPLYYNSRPREYKEYSSQGWYDDRYYGYGQNYEQTNSANRKKAGGRRPSLERQTTLYDDQYYSDQQYYDGTDKSQYQTYGAHSYVDYYSQDYGYQNERYGEEEEDKQWDSGGYYYQNNYAISSADNYQNIINKNRSSKKLPTAVYSNSSQDDAFYTPNRGANYGDDTADSAAMTAANRRKLLKQQRQSSDNYGSATAWQSEEKETIWQSVEDHSYYNNYNAMDTGPNNVVMTPSHPPKKRALPQVRTPSRCKASAVSLPQTPVRQLPNPLAAINKQRVSAPVSRTTSADYDQNGVYETGTYNENYNYAYVSSDNLQNDKFGGYPGEIRTNVNYQTNYEGGDAYADSYQNKENYPGFIGNYQMSNENYQNSKLSESIYEKVPIQEEYYPGDYYEDNNLKPYCETGVNQDVARKNFLERRSNNLFTQQNTDSLESRDDELRDESFETAVDSICSPVPVQKQTNDYSSVETGDLKPEPPKQPEQQQPTGMLGGLFSQLTRSPSQHMQKQQQQQQQQQQQKQPQQPAQKTEQRSRDQSTLLTNPALAAVNVTKGIFSTITNAVNNTVQNINKQQQQMQQQQKIQQQPENQIQRIQVTKRGSLKQQETVENHLSFKNRQNSFDSQIQDYMIPEEPAEYYEEKEGEEEEEEEYYDQGNDYYAYDEKEYTDREESEPPAGNNINYLNQRNDSESLPSKRNNLRHQDTIESEGKRFEGKNRNYLRQQDSLDSYAEEMVLHSGHRESPTDRYETTRTGTTELLRNGSLETNHLDSPRKRGSGHDNSLIEPYHPNWTGSELPKGYSPSPPIIQKQQSVDLEGIEEEIPEEPSALPEGNEKTTSFEEVPEEPVKVIVPERRKMTAKERWHRAYNVVVQQLNVLAAVMDELQNSDSQHTTEWALLFPLRTGLLSLKSSFSSLTDSENQSAGLDVLYRTQHFSQQNINRTKMVSESSSVVSSAENLHHSPKPRIRRRSSMSDLDKIGSLKPNVGDMSRSITSHSYEHAYSSTPNSPHSHYMRQIHKSENVRGSIGDFMNFKRFGGSGGFRTETIIAKTVPLTTVTKRSRSKDLDVTGNQLFDDEDSFRSSRNSFRGSRSSFNDSKTSLESLDSILKPNRTRKCGVAFSENLLLQHYAKSTLCVGTSNRSSVAEELGKVEKSGHPLAESSWQCSFEKLMQNGSDNNHNAPLSGSQRTERLSRIIRQQHSTHQLYANIYVSTMMLPSWLFYLMLKVFSRFFAFSLNAVA